MRLVRNLLLGAPLLGLALLFQMLTPRGAETLPLFARKYSVPCTTCHLAFPRLNSFGMAFRQNGYRMPGAKGESPWESTNFPLALVGNVGYSLTSTDSVVDPSTGRRERFNLSGFQQNTVEFHSAGTLAQEVTFRFDNNFAGVNGPLTSGEAFLQFDDVAHDGRLNVKAGVYDADILYLADSRRTTLSHYLSPVTLAGYGVEANGTGSGWTYALGLNNSNRTHGTATDRTLNNFENVYAWLMRDVNGQLVTARIFLDSQDPRDSTKSSSRHVQAELNAYLNRRRWVVIPGVTYEHFADANLTQRDQVVTALLEAMALLDSDGHWTLTGRYELQHSPRFVYLGSEALPEQDVAAMVANVGYYVNPNAKLALEYARLSNNVRAPNVDQMQVYFHVAY